MRQRAGVLGQQWRWWVRALLLLLLLLLLEVEVHRTCFILSFIWTR
jgi:hypothetical protein